MKRVSKMEMEEGRWREMKERQAVGERYRGRWREMRRNKRRKLQKTMQSEINKKANQVGKERKEMRKI